MTFPRVGETAVLDQLTGYGTSEGVKKSWEKRRRANRYQNTRQTFRQNIGTSLIDENGYLNVDIMSKVGSNLGSNPGGIYQAPDGTQFYVKIYGSSDHARNEVLAAKLYELAGARVPVMGLGKLGGKTVVASKMISGLQSLKNQHDAPEKMRLGGAHEDFAADAWLQNWDTVGLEYDNISLLPNGKAVRVDFGGSLRYRAQGGEKPEMPNTVIELDTLRKQVPGYHDNPQAHAVFGSMSNEDLMGSMKKVFMTDTSTIKYLVSMYGPNNPDKNQKLMDTLIARRNYIAKKYLNMRQGKWRD